MAKNAKTCLFPGRLGYAYGVSDKSMTRSSVHSYFIGYFDAVDSDVVSQRRKMPTQILAKDLRFPVLPYANLSNNEYDKLMHY